MRSSALSSSICPVQVSGLKSQLQVAQSQSWKALASPPSRASASPGVHLPSPNREPSNPSQVALPSTSLSSVFYCGALLWQSLTGSPYYTSKATLLLILTLSDPLHVLADGWAISCIVTPSAEELS